MNPLINMLMSNLQKKNPQGYNMVNSMMQNNGDPNAILKQVMGKASPEQKQQVLNAAKSYGCPENILSQIQNMK